jgi:DNA-binding MarR family transcriptional regulator
MHNQENICDNVLSLLRKITRSIDQRSRGLIKEYGLTVPQILILKEVCNSDEPINASQIANSVSLSPATVTPIIEKLVQRGYLNRERSDRDRRKVKLIPTSQGIELYNNAPTLMHEQFIVSFNTLKDWEQSMILSSLERIADMIHVKPEGTAPILDPTTIE